MDFVFSSGILEVQNRKERKVFGRSSAYHVIFMRCRVIWTKSTIATMHNTAETFPFLSSCISDPERVFAENKRTKLKWYNSRAAACWYRMCMRTRVREFLIGAVCRATRPWNWNSFFHWVLCFVFFSSPLFRRLNFFSVVLLLFCVNCLGVVSSKVYYTSISVCRHFVRGNYFPSSHSFAAAILMRFAWKASEN